MCPQSAQGAPAAGCWDPGKDRCWLILRVYRIMVLERVTDEILHPAQMDVEVLRGLLGEMLRPGVDYADIYLQNDTSEGWILDEGIIKSGHFDITHGVGVRSISGEKCCLAHSNVINTDSIRQCVRSVRSAGRTQGSGDPLVMPVLSAVRGAELYSQESPMGGLDNDSKIRLLQEMDRYARDKCPWIKQFNASVSGSYSTFLVAASDGTLAADIRPRVTMRCGLVVEKDGRRERGSSGGGMAGGYSFFLENEGDVARYLYYVDDAIRQAMLNLESVPAPAGSMTVVLASGKAGVLIHEAVGHGLEGDSCRLGTSLFSGLMGQKVASEICSVVDDGSMPSSTGSCSVDDEGTPGRRNVLIENGQVSSFMYDRHNARLCGKTTTGNGRRMSFSSLPIPRMTNTFMLPGKSDPQDIISSVEHGIYAVDFAGGQVDTANGQFVFEAQEAYLLENGKIGAPIKGATLIGNALEVMNGISMVGNDLAFDPGLGSCGKLGQWVPVGIGIPTLRLDSVTVGGTGGMPGR